jgi:hypothetical protein
MKKSEVWVYQMWMGTYETLFSEIGDRDLVVMVSSAFVDLVEKVGAAEKALGFKTVWMSKKILGLVRGPQGQVVSDFQSITKMVNQRSRQDNVIFFMGHAACSFATIPKLRAACPGAKFVSYVYDWMHLFCPEEHIDLWKQYTPTGESIADKEYEAINGVIKGDLVDAVFYKDAGESFPMLSKCQARGGCHWLPPVIPKQNYQKPPKPDVEDRIAYIGTIVPKRTHGREAGLFQDIMMEDVFKLTVAQGYQIDAYSLTPDQEVLSEYKKLFPKGEVRVNQGMLIADLLPVLAGRYKWGWMTYLWTTDLIMEHIKVSIPVKFFTYLSLGVPILISREMEACGEIIDKYGCGVRVGQDELRCIREVSESYDYEKLLVGVQSARQGLCLEKFTPRVEKVLKSVMEMPYEETTFGRQEAKERAEAKAEERQSNE